MRLRRTVLLSLCASLTILSCAKPRTFDVSRPVDREPVSVQPQSQAVNVTAVANRALQTRRDEQVMFLVAASHNEEQPARLELRSDTSQSVAATPSSLGPCGGDLPPCSVKQRESGGDYRAVNPTGCGGRSCGGAWQFDPTTWNGYGGYQFAQDAPPEVQDAKARELYAGGAGCGHWASC